MKINKIIIFILFSNLIFMQEFDEKLFICGPKKERQSMCQENKQFLINYWIKNDYSTVIELASNHILCECTN